MSNVAQLFPAPEIESRFHEFWKEYPRKIGKPIAKAKFDAITSAEGLQTKTKDKDSGNFVDIELKAEPQEIIDAAIRYRKSQIDRNTYKLKDDGRFIPHPATWLNQGRFWDEI